MLVQNRSNWLAYEDERWVLIIIIIIIIITFIRNARCRLAKLLQSDEFLNQLRQSDSFNAALAEGANLRHAFTSNLSNLAESLHTSVGNQLANPKLQRQLGCVRALMQFM